MLSIKVHIMLGMKKRPVSKRFQILSMLSEGSSMLSISRVADVSINTVSKILAARATWIGDPLATCPFLTTVRTWKAELKFPRYVVSQRGRR
jgi:DNA-binding CsgD family transcriptional regulator